MKSGRKSVQTPKQEKLAARPYQVEMAEIAKHESVIIKLNTGLGKTFIAVIVIKHHLPETYKPLAQGGKRIVFICKTVHLVYQHAEFLRTQLPIPSEEVGIFHGTVAPGVWIDSWDQNVWRGQLENHKVLVATAGVFRDVLNHRKVSLNDVCLLIFDECHHADPDTKSDFTDICQHLHAFPPGRWRPDYSRGPKVLGLTASVVNNVKQGTPLDTKLRRLEALMRARLITSEDSSIAAVMGKREQSIVPFSSGGSQALAGEPYSPFYQALAEGVKTLSGMSLSSLPDFIDLESLFDSNRRIRKEDFLNVMQFEDANPKKFKRIIQQCMHVMEEFGPWCADMACQLTEKAFSDLASSVALTPQYNPECLRAIRTCLCTLARAHELYTTIRDQKIARARRPTSPTDSAWGEWILAHFPMTNKMVQLMRLLAHFKEMRELHNMPSATEQSAAAKPDASAFHALVLVKERITTSTLCRFISELSAMAPQYSGLKASYCVSANPTRNLASMSTGEQLDVLDGFRKGAFNVLVATNVIEEGLDVRACNVVIKVDPVTNFRSFIQSQGRARAAHSHYVLMTEDKMKCQATVESFRRLEKELTIALRDRCVDTVEEEDVSDSVFNIAKQSYMPFGVDGPRITPSSAPSVLMRYVSTLKTDASYVLKILYSHKKMSLGGYQVQLLLPPPCPLQEIITGPVASTREVAKSLARVAACRRLHEAGLLNDELLPLDFRQLIELCKRNSGFQAGLDEEFLNMVLSRMHRAHKPPTTVSPPNGDLSRHTTDNGASPKAEHSTYPPMHSIMSQAQLLLTPLGDDFSSEPYIIPCNFNDDDVNDTENEGNNRPVEVDISDDEAFPYIERLDTPPPVHTTEQQRPPVYFEPSPPTQPRRSLQTPTTITPAFNTPISRHGATSSAKCPAETVQSLELKRPTATFFEERGIDEELPLTENRKSAGATSMTRARFYQFHHIYCLSAPYQKPMTAGRPAYLYTWSLPKPDAVARLTKVHASCFKHFDQTIGLVFSKPIARSNFVCRIPLYLQGGLCRVRLVLRAVLNLSADQLAVAQQAHQVLARLSSDMNRPANFGVQYSGGRLSYCSAPTATAMRSQDEEAGGTGSGSSPPRAVCVDPFTALAFDLNSSPICALFMIVRLPNGRMDEEASRALVNWSVEQANAQEPNGQRVFNAPSAPPDNVVQGGVVCRFAAPLSVLPPSQWAGLLVRPVSLPHNDPGGFAVSGVNSKGLHGNSPICAQMAQRLPEHVRQGRAAEEGVSFATFFKTQYTHAYSATLRHHGINVNLPLASSIRISRHLNAAIVSAGRREDSKGVHVEDRLPDMCILHPLNAWLWLTLCLTPTVLYQVTRCLSACELANLLTCRLYDRPTAAAADNTELPFGLPEGDFLMPDRGNVSLTAIPPLQRYFDNLPRENRQIFDKFETLEEESALDEAILASRRTGATPSGDAVTTGRFVPDPVYLLEATTTLNAVDAVNLERLELLGDSMLKFAASLLVYSSLPPSADEGQLTYLRMGHISNANLHRLSVELGLYHYLWSFSYDPTKHYTPPGFFLYDAETARKSHDPRLYVKIYDKAVADSVEALLGAFLYYLQPSAVTRLLAFFGLTRKPQPLAESPDPNSRAAVDAVLRQLWVSSESWNSLLLPPDRPLDPDLVSEDQVALERRHAEVEVLIADSMPNTPRTANSDANDVDSLTNQLASRLTLVPLSQTLANKKAQLAGLESILGYKFRHIRLLIQAITHASSLSAHDWGCYQRLEFLGDAILDFVVTQRVFLEHPTFNPGELTDLRTALVSNINLAIVAVRLSIHRYLDQTDPTLWENIGSFAQVVLEQPYKLWQLEDQYSGSSRSLSYKVLGDMVEAIIGAVYIDCGGSMPVITSVIYKLLDREFEVYGQDIPVDPIRLMHETYPKLEISSSEKVVVDEEQNGGRGCGNRRTVCRIQATHNGRTFVAEGPNLRAAKLCIAHQLGVSFG